MFAYYSTLEPKIQARRFDDGLGNRFYYFGNEVAAGITTVFGAVSTEREFIEKWKNDNPNWKELLDKSASYGSIEHEIFAEIITGNGVDYSKVEQLSSIITSIGGSPNTPKKDVLSFMRWVEDVELEPLVVEGVLVWKDKDGECLAMTIDLLANITTTTKENVQVGTYKTGAKKGQPKYKKAVNRTKKLSNVDFKSNFFEKERKSYYEGHKMQLIGAARAVYQNFDLKVEGLYNWSPNNWRDEPTYTFYEHEIKDQDLIIWDAYWNLAKAKGINRPKGRIFRTQLRDSKDYEFLTYHDIARHEK